MPTDQPNDAPIADQPRQTDDLSAAALLHDPDRPAGGGGLGAPTGAGAVPAPAGGAAALDGEVTAAEEARVRSVDDAPAEPGHTSQ